METGAKLVRFNCHGEAIRLPTREGTLILSQLARGTSRIVAQASSVKFVLEGEVSYSIGGRSRVLRAGEFMLVDAGCEAVVRVGSESAIGLCVYLPASGSLEPSDLAAPVIRGSGVHSLAREMSAMTRQLLCGLEPDGESVHSIISTVQQGAEAFLDDFQSRAGRLAHIRAAARTEILQRLDRARSLIHASVDRPISLEELAREAALSRFHFIRMYAEAFGSPPLRYHRSLRLAHAATQLQTGASSPTELAEDLGYANLSAFTRAFRSEFGVPPSRHARAA